MKASNLTLTALITLISSGSLSAYYDGNRENRDSYYQEQRYSQDRNMYYPNENQRYYQQNGYEYSTPYSDNQGYYQQNGYDYSSPSYQGQCAQGQCQPRQNPQYSNSSGYYENRNNQYGQNNNSNQQYNQGNNQNQYANSNQSSANSKYSSDLASKISNQLQNDQSLSSSARNIQVTEENGAVTLTGNVDNSTEKAKVESVVRRIDGVKSVSNKLAVAKG